MLDIFSCVNVLQVRIRHPAKNLYGKAVKRALCSHVVEPVRAFGHSVLAFRVIWRVDGDELSRAWDTVLSQRRLCDQVVARLPSVQMFVSCVTGVFTNPAQGRSDTPVYPAVSYWAACEGRASCGTSRDLSRMLNIACPSAAFKYIEMPAFWDEHKSLADDCATLFVALKEHNGEFVYQKSGQRMRDQISGRPTTHAHFQNAKVFVSSRSKYLELIPTTVQGLKVAGIRVDPEVFEGTEYSASSGQF